MGVSYALQPSHGHRRPGRRRAPPLGPVRWQESMTTLTVPFASAGTGSEGLKKHIEASAAVAGTGLHLSAVSGLLFNDPATLMVMKVN